MSERIENEIIEVNGTRWKIREARSMQDALNSIAFATVSGSVGSKQSNDETYVGGDKYVVADVVKVNSDDTEVQPYSTPY